jgi:hypothetical protein
MGDLNQKTFTETARPVAAFKTINAAELAKLEFAEVEYLVDGLIPEGLIICGGKPKFGKSLFATQLAVHVSNGLPIGDRAVAQGDVLYLALEDNQRRLKDRLLRMSQDASLDRIELATEACRLGDEFIESVKEWHDRVETPKLLIVDTYASVRPKTGQTTDDYASEYGVLQTFLKLVNELQISIMVVHHQKKGQTDDRFDSFLGSTGITAAADTLMLLTGSNVGPVLIGKGRDIEEFELALKRNSETLCWDIIGDADAARKSDSASKILDVLSIAPLSPKEIADRSGLAPDNVRQRLPTLVKNGDVVKLERGLYAIPD